jgi:hypothetical protein
MEGAARELADLARRAAVAGVDLGGAGGAGGGGPTNGVTGGLRVGGEELLSRMIRYMDEAVAVSRLAAVWRVGLSVITYQVRLMENMTEAGSHLIQIIYTIYINKSTLPRSPTSAAARCGAMPTTWRRGTGTSSGG